MLYISRIDIIQRLTVTSWVIVSNRIIYDPADMNALGSKMTPLDTNNANHITTPELLAIRGQSSAASFPTGPVIAEPFISPFGLTITPALSSKYR